MLLEESTQLIAISYLEHQQRRKKIYNIPKRLTFIKYRLYPHRHIFVYLQYGCTVAASESTTWKNGKKYAAAMSK